MYSEKDISELRYQVNRLLTVRSVFLGFAITLFIATPILIIIGLFSSNILIILGLVSLAVAILLLIIRSTVFSSKVDQYNTIIANATKEREKNIAEQEAIEKAEKIYRKIKQIDKEDDFSIDDLK